jgi:hypothetical protein
MERNSPSTQKDRIQKSTKKHKKTLQSTTKWIGLGLIIVLLSVMEFGFWKGVHIGSLWRNISLEISSTSWQRSFDRFKIEKQIQSQLQDMSTFLESGDTTSALQYVHPDQQEKYTQAFAAYPDRIPALIEGLRSAKVVFISPKSNTYDAERMARVKLQIPQEMSASSEDTSYYSSTLTCILFEEKWVIDT